MNVEKIIAKFFDREQQEEERAKKYKKNVDIDPDTYIAKEIKYQTALLKDIQYQLSQLSHPTNIVWSDNHGAGQQSGERKDYMLISCKKWNDLVHRVEQMEQDGHAYTWDGEELCFRSFIMRFSGEIKRAVRSELKKISSLAGTSDDKN